MPVATMLLAMWAPEALASGRVAVGMSGTTGINPIEPTWRREVAGASAVGCLGVDGWWLTGGHAYAGPRGEVRRSPDEERWGLTGQLCPTSAGGTGAGLGVAYGRQWGGSLYVTAHNTAGLSVFAKEGPEDGDYLAIAPYIKPMLALGVALPPGLSVEAGPYAWIAPPLLQTAKDAPAGMFIGHFGLQATLLLGAGSPQVPWSLK